VRRNPGSTTLAWLAHDKGDWSGTEQPATLFERQFALAMP
jgi:hypothetical protein